MLNVSSRTTNTAAPHNFEDELAGEIMSALRQTGYLELFNIDVRVDGHDVLLCGSVSSYFMKQKAEYIVRSLPGVAVLTSDIDVASCCRP
jgi:osmotically-inducible protein OsmY